MEQHNNAVTQKSCATWLNALAQWAHDRNKKWWLDLTRPCHVVDCQNGLTCSRTDVHGLAECIHDTHCFNCGGAGFEQLENRNVGELLMLCVSELAEALEGHRKGLQDDKLPHRDMFTVELADCLVRIFDIAGGMGLDIGGAFEEKMEYNRVRADHKIENRLAEGGKKY